jgi:Domain of unknown function (DUF4211)
MSSLSQQSRTFCRFGAFVVVTDSEGAKSILQIKEVIRGKSVDHVQIRFRCFSFASDVEGGNQPYFGKLEIVGAKCDVQRLLTDIDADFTAVGMARVQIESEFRRECAQRGTEQVLKESSYYYRPEYVYDGVDDIVEMSTTKEEEEEEKEEKKTKKKKTRARQVSDDLITKPFMEQTLDDSFKLASDSDFDDDDNDDDDDEDAVQAVRETRSKKKLPARRSTTAVAASTPRRRRTRQTKLNSFFTQDDNDLSWTEQDELGIASLNRCARTPLSLGRADDGFIASMRVSPLSGAAARRFLPGRSEREVAGDKSLSDYFEKLLGSKALKDSAAVAKPKKNKEKKSEKKSENSKKKTSSGSDDPFEELEMFEQRTLQYKEGEQGNQEVDSDSDSDSDGLLDRLDETLANENGKRRRLTRLKRARSPKQEKEAENKRRRVALNERAAKERRRSLGVRRTLTFAEKRRKHRHRHLEGDSDNASDNDAQLGSFVVLDDHVDSQVLDDGDQQLSSPSPRSSRSSSSSHIALSSPSDDEEQRLVKGGDGQMHLRDVSLHMLSESDHFKHYLQFVVSASLDRDFASLVARKRDAYFLTAIQKIEGRIHSQREGVLRSESWRAGVVRDIVTLPNIKVHTLPSKMSHSVKCSACNRKYSRDPFLVVLSGWRYDAAEFWRSTVLPDDFSDEDAVLHPGDLLAGGVTQQHRVGVFCRQRLKQFHTLQHFKLSLFLKSRRKIDHLQRAANFELANADCVSRLLDDTLWTRTCWRQYNEAMEGLFDRLTTIR